MRVDVIGVHPVAASEPCHLVEVLITGGKPADIVASITQETPDQPRDNWQVPYDEHYLTADGTKPEESAPSPEARVAFFFHYLDLRRPLLSAAGSLQLPAPSSRPARLDFIRYEPPC
jgi:hypothetical protein